MKDHVTFMGSHKNVGLTIIDFKRSIMPHDSADAPIPMEGPCQVCNSMTLVVVYDRNHYFGFGLILKPKPKLADTFGRYRNRYRNYILKGESSYP